MASAVTSYHAVKAKTHRWAQEEKESESPLVSNSTVKKSNVASPVVVPSQISSIRSYGIYDELMRQYAARQQSEENEQNEQNEENAQQSVPSSVTPRASSVRTASPGPPQTSVTKSVHVMMEDMMREVFVGESGAGEGTEEKVVKALDLSSGSSLEEEEREGSFTIAALPSPTRDQHAVRDVGGRRFDGKVVLELDVMSPLLKEMREIERVSMGVEEVAAGDSGVAVGVDVDVECGTEEVGPQEVAGRDRADLATIHGTSRQVKRVPSLVQYFQEQAAVARDATTSSVAKAVVDVVKKQAKRVAGSKKPPLLPSHNGPAAQASEVPSFEKFLEVFGLRQAFDHGLMWVSRATQGRRKMMAVVALSYLVLLHVFLISGRLGG